MKLALIPQSQLIALDAGAATSPHRPTPTEKALQHCKDKWENAYALAKTKGQAPAKALRMASVAYKLAMPHMDNLTSIRAYISCIAQGIQLEVFDGRDGSQLLYAAQVAMSTIKPKGGRK